MKKFMYLATLVVAMIGIFGSCGDDDAKKIVGNWKYTETSNVPDNTLTMRHLYDFKTSDSGNTGTYTMQSDMDGYPDYIVMSVPFTWEVKDKKLKLSYNVNEAKTEFSPAFALTISKAGKDPEAKRLEGLEEFRSSLQANETYDITALSEMALSLTRNGATITLTH